MKAYVDQELCIGCGMCVGICPKVFSLNKEGLSVAVDQELDDVLLGKAEEAASMCPTEAIIVK